MMDGFGSATAICWCWCEVLAAFVYLLPLRWGDGGLFNTKWARRKGVGRGCVVGWVPCACFIFL